MDSFPLAPKPKRNSISAPHPLMRWMGAVVRYHREQCGLTQAQLGAHLKLSMVQWCRIEQGNRALTEQQLLHVCSQLNWDPHKIRQQAQFLYLQHPRASTTAVWRFATASSYLSSLRDLNNGALSTE